MLAAVFQEWKNLADDQTRAPSCTACVCVCASAAGASCDLSCLGLTTATVQRHTARAVWGKQARGLLRPHAYACRSTSTATTM